LQICLDNLGLSKDIKKNEGFIAFFTIVVVLHSMGHLLILSRLLSAV